jgi:hypothetical protein
MEQEISKGQIWSTVGHHTLDPRVVQVREVQDGVVTYSHILREGTTVRLLEQVRSKTEDRFRELFRLNTEG